MQDRNEAIDGETINNSVPLIAKSRPKDNRFVIYQYSAFFLTAILYAISHASRTVYGYVKHDIKSDPYFSDSHLGIIDFTFMSAYAIGQYVNGYLGDRINIKISLGVGLVCAALGLSLFGYLEGIKATHIFAVDLLVFIINGLGQSTGYPGCVCIVSNWFANSKTGLVFGLWGTSLNIGNILGQQIGRIVTQNDSSRWPYALYITAGLLVVSLAAVILFTKVSPKELLPRPVANAENEAGVNTEALEAHASYGAAPHGGHGAHGGAQGISFLDAWKIKHVPSYGLAFFCIKGVVYGVLFWLPTYLQDEVHMIGDISIVLASIELGQLAGSIIFGYISDRIKSKSITIAFGFFFAVVFLLCTYLVRSIQAKSVYFTLLFLAGMGIGGPASLIGGAVSSDLGQRLLETSGVNAISTITGIMEGCGAAGAALTQLWVAQFQSIVFPTFAILCMAGGLLMLPIAIEEYRRLMRTARASWNANEGNSPDPATQNE